jgi:hypothetical protein
VSNSQQVKDPFGSAKIEKNPIIVYADPVGSHSLLPMMDLGVQSHSQSIYARFNSGSDVFRQFEERSVEIPRIYLKGGAH